MPSSRISTFILAIHLFALTACRPVEPPTPANVSINIATFCDSAADDNGKLTVHGTFDTIFAAEFPALHPRCSLAFRISFAKEELTNHLVRIRFINHSGRRFLDDVNTTLKPRPTDSYRLITTENLIINLTDMKLPNQGTYFVELWLDGRLITTLHLHARLSATPAVVGIGPAIPTYRRSIDTPSKIYQHSACPNGHLGL